MKYVTSYIKTRPNGQTLDGESIVRSFTHLKDATNVAIYRQTVDARKKDNVLLLTQYSFDSKFVPDSRLATPLAVQTNLFDAPTPTVKRSATVAVIGAGPSGLFCSYLLAKRGFDVTLFDKGGDTLARKSAYVALTKYGAVNPNCNIQNGLGGAGTFSDGKLTTGINSPYTYTVFDTLRRMGAPEQIMYSSTPHIGSDILPQVIENFASQLRTIGVKIVLNCKLTDLSQSKNQLKCRFDGYDDTVFDKVVLACGHSARDIYSLLQNRKVEMEQKPFSIGVRIEHAKNAIDKAQYGEFAEFLPSADYKLAYHCKDGRGVYTFCMCPGGFVTNSTDSADSVVTNGMSLFARNAPNSNSALLVAVNPSDYDKGDVLDGMRFQQYYEHQAFICGRGKGLAPCQNVTDFLLGVKSSSLDLKPSFLPGVTSTDLAELLPPFVVSSMREALPEFGRKIKNFASSGVMTAVESRSSSPVRILRNAIGQTNLVNLYAIGEGAGYAGGIVSSAVDGIKIAMEISNE